jgi:DNA-binding transcriptional LysR family regulator
MQVIHTALPGVIGAIHASDLGSFTAAAKVLDLTPAAVSKSVAALEAQLKVRLFNRTTRQLSLTEEGKAFIAQARIGLQALELAAALATQKQAPQGVVRMNCPVGFVLPLLPDFYKAHPQVQIELALNDQQVDLVRDGFDIGIRGGSQPPEGMVARKICEMPVVLVASPKYIRQHGVPAHYSALTQHHLIRIRFLTGRLAPWLFKEKGRVVSVEAPARLVMSDPEMVLEAALQHLGIARMSRHHAFDALNRGDLVELLADQHISSGASMAMFYPHRAGLAPRVRVFADFLMERLKANQALQVR